MAKLSTDELLDVFKEMTLIELSEFVKQFEDTFGVTAAAPVAVAAAPAAGGARCRWRGGCRAGRVRRHPRGRRREEDQRHQGGARPDLPRSQGGQGPGRVRAQAGRREGHQGRRREGQGGPRGRRRHGHRQVTVPVSTGLAGDGVSLQETPSPASFAFHGYSHRRSPGRGTARQRSRRGSDDRRIRRVTSPRHHRCYWSVGRVYCALARNGPPTMCTARSGGRARWA